MWRVKKQLRIQPGANIGAIVISVKDKNIGVLDERSQV